MKNKYFADINDYRKYLLLRSISDSGKIKIAICWMLTPDDERNDGKLTNYINNPNTWREKDPWLFDTMSECLKNGNRNVSMAEKYSIIPNAVYYDSILFNNSIKRKEYFEKFYYKSQDCDLIFFDPDNGFEVKSSHPGTKNSNKYLYWEELSDFYKMDKSLLVYQHFPRIERSKYLLDLTDRIKSETEAKRVICHKDSKVVYFLIPQEKDLDHFLGNSYLSLNTEIY